MIWFNLALFVVSFLLTALLAPKAEIEDVRAQSLDNENFPRATENAPIPLVLGRVRITSPNTIWYGKFRTIPITKKIKTGLFSSRNVTVGHRYFIAMDLAIAMGPNVTISEMYIDDKLIWEGTVSDNEPTLWSVTEPSFFGGTEAGGGWIMGNWFYPGSLDINEQPVAIAVENELGSGEVPAYLGTAHIVMDGEIGESPQLRKIAFVAESYSNDLGDLPDDGKIGDDINPAEAIYQIFVNTWRGMGNSEENLDLVALKALGNTCHEEGNGVSIQITSETQGITIIKEILRQIDGVGYQDPETGKIVFKLIRSDYDVADLPIYDEDDVVKITNFSRTGWDDVITQVKISFPQIDKDSSVIAISQDMATIGMIGRMKSTTISMPFCYDADLANFIASRERAQLSVPLFRMTLEMNRNANTLRPGDVFRLNWSQYNFSNLVMRVQEFDFGALLDGRIVVKCLQDNFAIDSVLFGSPAPSAWTAPVVSPQEITVYDLLEMPRFFQKKLEYPIEDGNAGVIPLALSPSDSSSAFNLVVGISTGDSNLDITEPENVTYAASGLLENSYSASEGIVSGIDTSTGLTVGSLTGSFNPAVSSDEVRTGESGLIYVDGEWMGFTGVTNNMDDTVTLNNIHRGLMGTTQKTHSASTRVWQVTPEFFGEGILDNLLEDGTVYWKMLDKIGPAVKSISSVTEQNTSMTSLADRPVRPRNLLVAGSRDNIKINRSTDRFLSWVSSNRESFSIPLETDPEETPDQTEEYNVEIWIDGTKNLDLSSDGETSPYLIPFTSLSSIETDDAEIRVYSVRSSGDERISRGYAFLPFRLTTDGILLSGDAQEADYEILLSGDAQSGTDKIKLS